jgi:oligopeptide/dipeptide ABC transporter ATP-binding protein
VNEQILTVKNLKVSFKYGEKYIQVVRGIDITLKMGEILGILGESGSGKSVSATSILGLLENETSKIDAGSIMFEGRDLLKLSEKELCSIRGKKISYIFQDSSAALNPYIKVGKQIEEVLKIHGEKPLRDRVLSAMRDAGLENAELIYNMFPSQLSGGQCQRVMIALSTICRPEILIADEPTTSIDASLQKKVLELLKNINESHGTTELIITHDFDVAKAMCSRVVVMYGGLIMEEGSIENVIEKPLHPYTKELISCVESLNNNEETLYSLEGTALSPNELKEECPFYERCPLKSPECRKGIPELSTVGYARKVRCINKNCR